MDLHAQEVILQTLLYRTLNPSPRINRCHVPFPLPAVTERAVELELEVSDGSGIATTISVYSS